MEARYEDRQTPHHSGGVLHNPGSYVWIPGFHVVEPTPVTDSYLLAMSSLKLVVNINGNTVIFDLRTSDKVSINVN